MKDRKEEDYAKARRGTHNPVEDDNVHSQAEEDRRAIRGGKHTDLASDTGVREQGKTGRGY